MDNKYSSIDRLSTDRSSKSTVGDLLEEYTDMFFYSSSGTILLIKLVMLFSGATMVASGLFSVSSMYVSELSVTSAVIFAIATLTLISSFVVPMILLYFELNSEYHRAKSFLKKNTWALSYVDYYDNIRRNRDYSMEGRLKLQEISDNYGRAYAHRVVVEEEIDRNQEKTRDLYLQDVRTINALDELDEITS